MKDTIKNKFKRFTSILILAVTVFTVLPHSHTYAWNPNWGSSTGGSFGSGGGGYG